MASEYRWLPKCTVKGLHAVTLTTPPTLLPPPIAGDPSLQPETQLPSLHFLGTALTTSLCVFTPTTSPSSLPFTPRKSCSHDQSSPRSFVKIPQTHHGTRLPSSPPSTLGITSCVEAVLSQMFSCVFFVSLTTTLRSRRDDSVHLFRCRETFSEMWSDFSKLTQLGCNRGCLQTLASWLRVKPIFGIYCEPPQVGNYPHHFFCLLN